MSDRATINALRVAEGEIVNLRRDNEILNAQVHVVNCFSAALFGPRSGGAQAEDALWHVRNEIRRLSEATVPPEIVAGQ